MVTATNDSAFANTFDFRDAFRDLGTLAFTPHESKPIYLKSNHALTDGYGDLYYKKAGSGVWTHSGQKRNNEKVSLF